jgi:hypothetical protein
MENTLYYTFSTIAQSLAGAIAFVGAFVLFRLQAISQALRSGADILGRLWLGDEEIQRASAAGDFGALLARAEHLITKPVPSSWRVEHQAALDGMRVSLTQRKNILRVLLAVLLVAAVVMILAVAILSRVHQLAVRDSLAASALVLGVLAFAVSVTAIGLLVWRVVRGA